MLGYLTERMRTWTSAKFVFAKNSFDIWPKTVGADLTAITKV